LILQKESDTHSTMLPPSLSRPPPFLFPVSPRLFSSPPRLFSRYIQSWWRAVLGYREGQARLTAHRNQLKRYKGAVTIQNCWRCFVARKKADHKQLVRACLRVQNAWRCKQGRQSAHLVSCSSVFCSVMLTKLPTIFVACKKWM
jgi:hypothetical protein